MDTANFRQLKESVSDKPNRPWRVLQVEDDASDAQLVDDYLKDQLPSGSTVEHVDSLDAALQLIQQTEYDAVLLDLSLPDSQGLETLRRVIEQNQSTPVLVLSGDDNLATAETAKRDGASEFVLKSRLDGEYLFDALRKATGCDLYSLKETGKPARERRHGPRHPLSRAAVIVPVELDGSPGAEIVGTTYDISLEGIGILAERVTSRLPDVAMVGVESHDGTYLYGAVQWVNRVNEAGGIRLGGRFLKRAGDPFHESKLVPRLDAQQMRFVPALPEETIRQWSVRGVIRPYVIDRVKTCPRCNALPTFRDGCPSCGSGKTSTSQLIHHFACAHVAPVNKFEQNGLVCPKCRARDLIVGADYEYLDGPCRCVECDWSDTEPALIGECLYCGLRFSGSEALQKDVYQFYVERLQPLALIENTR